MSSLAAEFNVLGMRTEKSGDMGGITGPGCCTVDAEGVPNKGKKCIRVIQWVTRTVLWLFHDGNKTCVQTGSTEKGGLSGDLCQTEGNVEEKVLKREGGKINWELGGGGGGWRMISQAQIWKGGGVKDWEGGQKGQKRRELGRWQEEEWICRERRNMREGEKGRTSLQGGFPEVTVLNITEECGMLNRCQGKHTGRTTAAPNGCQGPFYIYTKGDKHTVIYVHEHI